jgi:uncharacterized protein YecT (DUF1311 family)
MRLDQCAGADFNSADVKLNAVYRQMIEKYDAQLHCLDGDLSCNGPH